VIVRSGRAGILTHARNLGAAFVSGALSPRPAGAILEQLLGALDRADLEERLRRLEELPEDQQRSVPTGGPGSV